MLCFCSGGGCHLALCVMCECGRGVCITFPLVVFFTSGRGGTGQFQTEEVGHNDALSVKILKDGTKESVPDAIKIG